MASSLESETFDWKILLKTEKLEAVPVSCIKHVSESIIKVHYNHKIISKNEPLNLHLC